jgi:hypothetical protein
MVTVTPPEVPSVRADGGRILRDDHILCIAAVLRIPTPVWNLPRAVAE